MRPPRRASRDQRRLAPRGSRCGGGRCVPAIGLTIRGFGPWKTDRMDLRIFNEPQQGASYDTLLLVARAAEDCGFDAFFRSDHYLKMGDISGLPGPTDAWVTLAGLARETTRLRLGTLELPRPSECPDRSRLELRKLIRCPAAGLN